MKKTIVVGIAMMATAAFMMPFVAGGETGQTGQSNNALLYLYEKDPATWEIVPDGAWGKMMYKMASASFTFSFAGHGLDPDCSYTLIYYPDPWPGEGLIVLGEGAADEDGNVKILQMFVNTGDLPASYDDNYDAENAGAKIWLVLSNDVDVDNKLMTGWNPTEYLFEEDLITYDDTSDSLSLVKKDPSDWTPVDEDDTGGYLAWNPCEDEFNFIFQAWGLLLGTDYTLIYYPDDWPGNGLIALGSGTTCYVGGCVHISGSVNTGDLPATGDSNYPDGAKMWLVLSDDVDVDNKLMTGWNPTEYLFECNLITFDDTDDP